MKATPVKTDSCPSMEALPQLRNMGISVFDPVWTRRRHRDSFAELLCVVRGSMTLAMEGGQIQLRYGDFAFIPPNTLHYDLFNPADSPEIFLVQYWWAAQQDFFQKVNNYNLAALPQPIRNEILRIILQLRDHRLSETLPDRILARSLMHTLLLRLWSFSTVSKTSEQEKKSGQSRRRDLMERTRQYIDTHYHEPQSLFRIAARLQVSTSYLSRVFSHESGFSLTGYLTSIRMFKAREMLQIRAGNVSDVAQAVGYTSNAHFSRVFKRHFNTSPSSVLRETPPIRR